MAVPLDPATPPERRKTKIRSWGWRARGSLRGRSRVASFAHHRPDILLFYTRAAAAHRAIIISPRRKPRYFWNCKIKSRRLRTPTRAGARAKAPGGFGLVPRSTLPLMDRGSPAKFLPELGGLSPRLDVAGR